MCSVCEVVWRKYRGKKRKGETESLGRTMRVCIALSRIPRSCYSARDAEIPPFGVRRTCFEHDALYLPTYLHATLRSVSRRDFPRVTRLRNRSVSRYDIRDDWPIAGGTVIKNWCLLAHKSAKIDRRQGNALRVSPRVILDIATVFLSRDDHWLEASI